MNPFTPRRLAASLFILAYVGASGYFLARHWLGDSTSHPLAYFWTWDMYPDYPAGSTRRAALARTRAGDYVRLLPDERYRFRWGRHGDVTRLDLDRRLDTFRRAADDALARRAAEPSNPALAYVLLVEQYWPARFNLPDRLYESVYAEPNPRRSYWRVLDEAPVGLDGAARWKP